MKYLLTMILALALPVVLATGISCISAGRDGPCARHGQQRLFRASGQQRVKALAAGQGAGLLHAVCCGKHRAGAAVSGLCYERLGELAGALQEYREPQGAGIRACTRAKEYMGDGAGQALLDVGRGAMRHPSERRYIIVVVLSEVKGRRI